jgi:uncharacterized protein (DUF983 family)
MFNCPNCGNKTISFFNKWRTFKRNPLACKVCGAGYYRLYLIDGMYNAIVSLLYPGLIIYFIFTFTVMTGLISFGAIFFIEILVNFNNPFSS